MSRYTGKPGHGFRCTTLPTRVHGSCSCGCWNEDSDVQPLDRARRSLEAQHRAHVGEEMGAT